MNEENIEVGMEFLEEQFEEFIKDYELDPEGSINDMLFEVFCAGVETALTIVEEEENEQQ